MNNGNFTPKKQQNTETNQAFYKKHQLLKLYIMKLYIKTTFDFKNQI